MNRPTWLREVQRHWFVRRPSAEARRRVQLQVASLEERLTPSTIIVNDNRDVLDNPADVTVSGLGSQVTLRDALNAANNTAGGDS
jgi:hypothetical protein